MKTDEELEIDEAIFRAIHAIKLLQTRNKIQRERIEDLSKTIRIYEYDVKGQHKGE